MLLNRFILQFASFLRFKPLWPKYPKKSHFKGYVSRENRHLIIHKIGEKTKCPLDNYSEVVPTNNSVVRHKGVQGPFQDSREDRLTQPPTQPEFKYDDSCIVTIVLCLVAEHGEISTKGFGVTVHFSTD
jgi:hypothetical protein